MFRVSTLLLFSVDWDSRAVHIQHHALGESKSSALAISSRLIRRRPSRSRLGSAPRSQTNAGAKAKRCSRAPRFSPSRIKRNVGSGDSRSASFNLRILPSDCRWTVAADRGAANWRVLSRRSSRMFSAMSALSIPNAHPNSRTKKQTAVGR